MALLLQLMSTEVPSGMHIRAVLGVLLAFDMPFPP